MLPTGWSIGSNGLTSHGQMELLKQLGSLMERDYAHVVNEPVPDHLRELLDRMDQHSSGGDKQDQ